MAQLLERLAKGKHEDLSDFIANVDAATYPVTSLIPKDGEPDNTYMEWPADNFPEPDTKGVVDGKDITDAEKKNAYENYRPLAGRIQLFRRVPSVSFLGVHLMNKAGVGKKKAMAKSIVKMLEVLKRDFECAICSNNDSKQDNGTDAYVTRGLGKWIQNEAQGDLPVDPIYRTPVESIISGVAAEDFTEDHLNDAMQSVWMQTKRNNTFQLVCGPAVRRRISGFARLATAEAGTAVVRTMNQDATTRKLMNTVDIYTGDFGTCEVVPSPWLAYGEGDANLNTAFMLRPDMLRAHMSPVIRLPQENNGGGESEILNIIGLLKVLNPLAHGKIVLGA